MSITATVTITKEVEKEEEAIAFHEHMLFLIQHVNDAAMHQTFASEPFRVATSIEKTFAPGEFPS